MGEEDLDEIFRGDATALVTGGERGRRRKGERRKEGWL